MTKMTTTESSKARASASPDDVVDRLFQVLHTMYGKPWVDKWEGAPMDAVKAEWVRRLTGISPQAIRLALDALIDQSAPFPPSLPEFVGLCRKFRRVGDYQLRLTDQRHEGPAEGFQSLRDILAKAGVPKGEA